MKNKRNVLLVSSFWSGIRPFFLEGKEEFRGMPAFTNTFLRLLHHSEIDIIYVFLFGKEIEKSFKIPNKYRDKLIVYGYSYSGKFSGFISLVQLFTKIFFLSFASKVDICYTHGPIGGIAALVSRITGLKIVRRLYGTFLARKLKQSKIKLFLSHPLEYLTFSLPGEALVITNDGSKGDSVYNKIGNKKMPLFFWLNGVEKTDKVEIPLKKVQQEHNFHFCPDICYVARIDEWKRQHLLLDILVELKKRGKVPNTIIAGPAYNKRYYEELKNIIALNKMESNVVLIPGLTRKETLTVIKNSKLSTSLYDFSNLGNVFLESLTLGTPMLSQNIENSLDLISKDAYFEIDPINVHESADKLESVLNNKKVLEKKANSAMAFSNKFLQTWGERSKKELKLLGLSY